MLMRIFLKFLALFSYLSSIAVGGQTLYQENKLTLIIFACLAATVHTFGKAFSNLSKVAKRRKLDDLAFHKELDRAGRQGWKILLFHLVIWAFLHIVATGDSWVWFLITCLTVFLLNLLKGTHSQIKRLKY